MRVLVTDYDGTLYREGRVAEETLAAIHRWRAAGNPFGIATGRDLAMTLQETDRWSIPYDFLICLNGAAIYDGDRRTLAFHPLDDRAVPAIVDHPAADAGIHIQLLGDGPCRLYHQGESWFPAMGLPYEAVDRAAARTATTVGQISLAYLDSDTCERWTEAVNGRFGDRVVAHRNVRVMDINARGITKAGGVTELAAVMGWDVDRIMAIGDGGNDLEMIRRFRGSAVPNAIPAVTAAARSVYPDVGALIRDLL